MHGFFQYYREVHYRIIFNKFEVNIQIYDSFLNSKFVQAAVLESSVAWMYNIISNQ